MNTIWKFPAAYVHLQIISMPKGAKILCVQVQDGVPTLWAEVETDNKNIPEGRKIQVVGYFDELSGQDKVYIGTFQEPPYVWHVYELEPNDKHPSQLCTTDHNC